MESSRTVRAQRWLIAIMIALACISACQPPDTPKETSPGFAATEPSQPETTPPGELTPEVTPQSGPPGPAVADSRWVKIYGVSQDSLGSDLIQASDGGIYVVGGIGEILDDEASGGVLLIKTDDAGRLLWSKVYGGSEFDIGWSILQTGDGDLVIAGQTASFGAGGMDAYLIRVDAGGEELWSSSYGSPLDESVSTVLESADGHFFLIGNQVDPNDFITDPGEAGYGGFGGRSEIYVVKTHTHIFEDLFHSDGRSDSHNARVHSNNSP